MTNSKYVPQLVNLIRDETQRLWSRSLDDPTEYVLVEAFRDGDAGASHVNSAHFRQAQQDLPQHLVTTPKIISQTVDQDDWSDLGELAVRD